MHWITRMWDLRIRIHPTSPERVLQLWVAERGYIFIWVSNETTGAEVWFDDLWIEHESPIVQVEDYYPFGLSMATSYQRVDALNNKFKYNGKELQSDLDLNWYDYGARMYDAALGRWHVVDPLADSYYDASPYHYSGNNPIRFLDVDGQYYVGTDGKPVTTTVNDDGKIQLSNNASADLQRMASLVNSSGSNKAVSQFVEVGNNETKVNFKISQEGDGTLLGLHQAHNANGNALDWDSKTGTFKGEVEFMTDSEGNTVYKEATITIFENVHKAIGNSDLEMVSTKAHEDEHNLNKKDIAAIKDRQEGKKNDRNVEKQATRVHLKVWKQIDRALRKLEKENEDKN